MPALPCRHIATRPLLLWLRPYLRVMTQTIALSNQWEACVLACAGLLAFCVPLPPVHSLCFARRAADASSNARVCAAGNAKSRAQPHLQATQRDRGPRRQPVTRVASGALVQC
jgi:hypothetical protein